MYLLNRLLMRKKLVQERNLHSTMYLLNLISAATCVALLSFTFHYVSIKSSAFMSTFLTVFEFTFHYVSIKSLIIYSTPAYIPDLHSTMYLLNPSMAMSQSVLKSSFTFHYVSIKSWKHCCIADSPDRFTFHYVSIKSILLCHQHIIY